MAAANQLKAKVDAATVAKNNGAKDLQEKQAKLTQTNEAVSASKAALDQANKAHQAAQAALATAKTKLDQQAAQLNQSKAAAKSATEGAAKLAETYQIHCQCSEANS